MHQLQPQIGHGTHIMQLPQTHMHALLPLAGEAQALMYTYVPLSTHSTRVSRVH